MIGSLPVVKPIMANQLCPWQMQGVFRIGEGSWKGSLILTLDLANAVGELVMDLVSEDGSVPGNTNFKKKLNSSKWRVIELTWVATAGTCE